MAAAQQFNEYAQYDYPYDPNAASTYQMYSGYESTGTYAAATAYDGYTATGAYPGGATDSMYQAVDPYADYRNASYPYPVSATAPGPPAATPTQPVYSTAYDSRRPTAPPPSSASVPSAAHYSPYEYAANATSVYQAPAPTSAVYPPYKATPTADSSASSAAYQSYPPAAAPSYGVPPASHLGGAMGPPTAPHMYGGPSPSGGAAMIPRRPDYYSSPPVTHPMHYVPHQAQSMPYRLPPRGGYQRELDEPGDENALLRHVVYITGLPKEIQNETLAEVFGAACGPIAPVDVRSPKPKIWVYKDRQTREGKGEATITFINPDSAQMAINYFNGKELFGREIRVTLCPRRMYNMQKQNTPFNPGAAPVSTTTPISSMIKSTPTNNQSIPTATTNAATPSTSTTTTTITTPSVTTTAPATSATNNTANTTVAAVSTAATTTTTTTPTTTSSSSNSVTVANPIATISSSTLGLPRQLNHSLFKFRQTPEQQRGLLPTPPIPFGAPMMSAGIQRDGIRKELPRIALTRGSYANPTGVRPKPY